MDRVFVCVLVVVASCLACGVHAYGETASNGLPVWQERANQVLVNAVRLDPNNYKSIYMNGYSPSPAAILNTSVYPAVAPVYMAPQLCASASNHSIDMVVSGLFQHDSSDGTPVFTRIKSFYSCSGYMGENIAAGYADPIATNNQWLCDQSGSACAADGSGSDGHRSNIMSKNYMAIGVGFDYSSTATYKNYWTQDFGGATCNPTITSPIYGGSHVYVSGSTKFITTLYTAAGTAPTSATVNVDGTAYSLTWELGASQGQGNYAFSQTKGTACRNYYFVFVVSGVTYRYPDTGFLVTYGEGSCVTSFVDGSVSTAAPVTTTSAPVTTTAPTTTTTSTAAPTTPTAAVTTSAPTTTTTTSTSAPATTTTSAPTTTTTTTTTTSAPTTTRAPTTTTRQASTAAPTTTGAASSFITDILNGHNAARALVKAANLIWNASIAASATNYANLCNFAHNANRGNVGENIYAASGAVSATTGKAATASWVGEKQYFNCAANTCASGQTCGHYTQVIWAGTTQVGCGAATCTTNSPFGASFPTWNFVVCDYAPPGNYVGQRPVPTTSC